MSSFWTWRSSGSTFFSYLVFVLFMVELVDEFDHLLGFRFGVHAVNELPLDVLQAGYPCYVMSNWPKPTFGLSVVNGTNASQF